MRKSRYVGNSDASSLTVDTVVCFPSELQLSLQRSFSGCCSSLRLEFLCDAMPASIREGGAFTAM